MSLIAIVSFVQLCDRQTYRAKSLKLAGVGEEERTSGFFLQEMELLYDGEEMKWGWVVTGQLGFVVVDYPMAAGGSTAVTKHSRHEGGASGATNSKTIVGRVNNRIRKVSRGVQEALGRRDAHSVPRRDYECSSELTLGMREVRRLLDDEDRTAKVASRRRSRVRRRTHRKELHSSFGGRAFCQSDPILIPESSTMRNDSNAIHEESAAARDRNATIV